jgi:hypothetical protein
VATIDQRRWNDGRPALADIDERRRLIAAATVELIERDGKLYELRHLPPTAVPADPRAPGLVLPRQRTIRLIA